MPGASHKYLPRNRKNSMYMFLRTYKAGLHSYWWCYLVSPLWTKVITSVSGVATWELLIKEKVQELIYTVFWDNEVVILPDFLEPWQSIISGYVATLTKLKAWTSGIRPEKTTWADNIYSGWWNVVCAANVLLAIMPSQQLWNSGSSLLVQILTSTACRPLSIACRLLLLLQ